MNRSNIANIKILQLLINQKLKNKTQKIKMENKRKKKPTTQNKNLIPKEIIINLHKLLKARVSAQKKLVKT